MILTTARAGEYCDDFENGDFGDFWTQEKNFGGQWKPSSFSELKETIPDFPEPASGDTVVYLTPEPTSFSMRARLVMKEAYDFSEEGSSIYFRYWLRSEYLESGTLQLYKLIGTGEAPKMIRSFNNESGPGVDYWKDVNFTLTAEDEPFKVGQFNTLKQSTHHILIISQLLK